MKVQVLQENLNKALSVTSRFSSAKAQLPILGNVLLEAKGAKLTISSTNLEVSAAVKIGADVKEEGSVSVPSRVVSDLIGNLEKGSLEMESSMEQLKIISPDTSSTILGMNPSDFPEIPTAIEERRAYKVSVGEFKNAISSTIFASSLDETRPVLTGICLVIKGDLFTVVATDGFRLSVKNLGLVSSGEENMLILPKSVFSEISRIEDGGQELSFSYNEKDKQVVFVVGDTVYSSKIIEGVFPDYEKIIPKDTKYRVVVDKEDFLRSVKLASVFAKDSANVVKLTFSGGIIDVSSESGQAGGQKARVDAKIDGLTGSEVFEISFNYKYLEDFLRSVGGGEVSMEFVSETAAGIFKDTKDEKYLHLIMPVRV